MRNITLRAEAQKIELARRRARAEGTTLNEQVGRWLARYASGERQHYEAMALLDRLQGYVRIGRMPTRDEMNERGPRP